MGSSAGPDCWLRNPDELIFMRKLLKTIGVHYSGDVNTKVDVGEAVKEVT